MALADPDPNQRQAAGLGVPAALVYADYRDMLKIRGLDAVIISVPTALHAEVAITAMQLGKHVYLEKPIAASLREADEIVSGWKRSGVVGMVGFNYRFNALHQAASMQIQAGKLGPLASSSLHRLARRLGSFRSVPYLVKKLRSPWHEPSYRASLSRFVSAARGRDTVSPDLLDGYRSLEVICAAEESAQTGRSVSLVPS